MKRLLLFFLLTPLAFAGETTIPVVENPEKTPDENLIFKEELRFGGGDEDEFIWLDGTGPANFDVDADGNFYVCDPKNTRVLAFDNKGNFVRSIGSKGEGPGEYQNPTTILVLEDGRLMVMDNLGAVTKFSYFKTDGTYLETKQPKQGMVLFNPSYSKSGQFITSGYFSFNLAEGKATLYFGLFDGDFNLLKTFSETDWPIPTNIGSATADDWSNLIGKQLTALYEGANFYSVFLPGDEFLKADGGRYTIEHWTKGHEKKRRSIEKKVSMRAFDKENKAALSQVLQETIFEAAPGLANIITEDVINKGIKKASLPNVIPPLGGLIPMENGGFLTVHKFSFSEGTVSGHVFDAKGHCIGSYAFPGKGVRDLFATRLLFLNGKLYAMEKNEDDDNVLTRYSYTFSSGTFNSTELIKK